MSATDIVNRALTLIDSQAYVSGVYPAFDGSAAGNAAAILYAPCVEMLLRRLDPDFARTRANLSIAAGATIVTPYAYIYTYPATCLRMRQLAPSPGSYDKNDPQPLQGEMDYDAGVTGRVILTNQVNAVGVFTTSAAGVGAEAIWDFLFQESVVRLLANPFAMALAGRPDFARELLDEADRFSQMAELNDEF